MARRQETSPLDDVSELLKLTPVWVGPILSLVVFVLLRWVAPHLFPVRPDGFDVGVVVRPLLPMLAWIVAGALLLAWVAAEIHKLFNRRLLDRQTGIDSIRNLPWPDFERLICEAYHRKGYLAEAVGGTSCDGGVDVELRGAGETIVVQCKQWRSYKVGVSTVRELLGVVVSRRATKGIVVTSGRFTRDANRFAAQNTQVELVDGPELAELIASVRTERSAPTAESGRSLDGPAPVTRPSCPTCGAGMVLRTARRGANAGSQFWGCLKYPTCRGTRDAGADAVTT